MIFQPAFRVLLLLLVAAGSMAACSSGQTRPVPGHKAAVMDVGSRAAVAAHRQVGAPYVYGGSSPRGFDCSGLVHFSYSEVGHAVPRTTSALWQAATPVDRGELRAGDILFFNVDGKMSHVGLYLGERHFVHAPSSGKFVSVETLDSPYYSRALLRAGRLR